MISAKILADSVNTSGDRLTTFELVYPRFIHSEIMTHRVFSRNAASSRAIPIEKMIKAVRKTPAMPVYWGKNQKGMQARVQLSPSRIWVAKFVWLAAAQMACLVASLLCKIGVHKQIANRVLEPWMHMCVIVSATDYRHMFGLRDHEDAQPEFACLVRYMRHELYQSTPRLLLSGEWHLPLVPLDGKESMPPQSEWPKVSAGRCARISYLTHDGKRDATSDVKLSEQLAANGHWSPFEHPATPLDSSTRLGNFRGWKQLRKFYDNEFLEG